MCFSATASFSLSAVLAGLGGASIAIGWRSPYRVFAATPLLFATQQATEGIVWMTLGNPAHAFANRVAVAVFLGLALIVWPVWLPATLRLSERDPARRRLLTALLAVGVIVAASAVAILTHSRPVAVVAGHSLRYDRSGSTGPTLDLLVLISYFIPTVLPLFVSTVRLGRTIGVALIVSSTVAALIQIDTLTSVWCFFAAIVSAVVILSMRQEQETTAIRRSPSEATTSDALSRMATDLH